MKVSFPLEPQTQPVEPGVYYFRGMMADEKGIADSEGWVEYSAALFWLFGNEQSYTIGNFNGEWWGPFEVVFSKESKERP